MMLLYFERSRPLTLETIVFLNTFSSTNPPSVMGSMRTHKKIGIAVGLKDLLIEAEFTLDSILKHGAQGVSDVLPID
jgi:hypothetical protein